MRRALQLSHRERANRGWLSTTRLLVVGLLFFGCYSLMGAVGASQAIGDVGDLGPPPADSEIRQALADFYSAGQPLGSSVDVHLDGTPLVGLPTEHANPPPDPWCVRCGYPDQGTSPMYPVMALVTVKINQGLESSSLARSSPVETTNTRNGTSCAGVTQSRYCPAYYFYRDGQGNWQIA